MGAAGRGQWLWPCRSRKCRVSRSGSPTARGVGRRSCGHRCCRTSTADEPGPAERQAYNARSQSGRSRSRSKRSQCPGRWPKHQRGARRSQAFWLWGRHKEQHCSAEPGASQQIYPEHGHKEDCDDVPLGCLPANIALRRSCSSMRERMLFRAHPMWP